MRTCYTFILTEHGMTRCCLPGDGIDLYTVRMRFSSAASNIWRSSFLKGKFS